VRTDDPALAAALRPALRERLAVERTVLDDELADLIEGLANPEVALPAGGRLHITPTPALVAIDVDAGAATAARDGKAEAQRGFNRAILPVLARQIRLRNLGGAILVDLAGLGARRRAALGPAMAAALAEDPARPRFLGFTALGLAEIVRPRVHPPLHELLAGPHAAGLAALREAMHRAGARPAEPLALRAAPAVIAALRADAAALPDLSRRTGRPLILRSDPALPGLTWTLETV
jgi:Ribonuclease G/E